MLARDKGKRIVDMTNEEAAAYYVRRARAAESHGELPRANRFYHSAILHDPNNLEAKRGFDQTAGQGKSNQPEQVVLKSHHARRRRHRRPWWKRFLGMH